MILPHKRLYHVSDKVSKNFTHGNWDSMVCETGYRLQTKMCLIVWLEWCGGSPEKQTSRRTINFLMLISNA